MTVKKEPIELPRTTADGFTLLATCVALITIIAFEAIAVTTAMPVVVSALQSKGAFPLASGMALTAQVASTIWAGTWADAKGPRTPLLVGLALFALGLAISAAAPTIAVFVLGRAVQGFGGGLLGVCLYVLVGTEVPPHRRHRYFAAFSAAWVGPSLIGPFLAGLIVEFGGWRLVFAAVAPLSIVLALPLFPVLSRIPAKSLPLPPRSRWRALTALATGLGIAVLQSLGAVGTSWAIAAGLGCLLFCFFTVRSLFPAGAFRFRTPIGAISLIRMLGMAVIAVIQYFLVLALQNERGWSPTAAGAALAVGGLTWAGGAFLQGSLTRRGWRKYQPPTAAYLLVLGSVLAATGPFVAVPWIVSVAGMAIVCFGMGLIVPLLAVLALEITEPQQHGEISAVLQLADAVGPSGAMGLIGLAFAPLIGTVFAFLPAAGFTLFGAFVVVFFGKRIFVSR